MKLHQKILSLLAAAALAALLAPACLAAPGDSITTRVANALNARTSADLYEEVATTSPDGTTQTMTMARSGGNAYLQMSMGEGAPLVYVLREGQGYLLDSDAKLAICAAVPEVTLPEEETAGAAAQPAVQGVETRLNVNGQDYDALSYTMTSEDGQTVTLSYCVEGETLKYTVIDAPQGRTITEFRVITPNVDQNLFTVPADYQVMTQEEWAAMAAEK